MDLSCFINHIGIKSCGATPSTSETFINELPGITFKMIDSITDIEQQTFVQFWDDIQKTALRKFTKEVTSRFTKKYEGFCCSGDECQIDFIVCTNIELFEEAWMYLLGVELMLARLYSDRFNRYTTIDRNQATELKDFYMVEFEKSLNHAIKYIPKEFIEKCFECRSQIDHVELLP
jgi:hypothetical protein